MRIRPHSLTARLTLYFALASTAVLFGAGSLIGARVQAHFVEQDLAEMKGKLELVRHMVARLQTADELEAVPRQLADALVGHEHLALAVQLAPQRSIFRTPGATFPAALAAWPPPADGPPIEWTQDGRHYRGLAGTAPTAIPGQAPLAVAIALDTRHHREFAAAFRASLAIALVCGIALSALLGWVAARRGLAPLHRLAQAVRGISAGRLEERLPGAAMPAELAELGLAFNQMLARLQESFERLSHFSDDLAHELRTPIGNLLLQTQVAASKARTADEYREVLYSSLEELERLARMVGDMLFIAQADNGLVVPSRVPIDLAAELQALFGFYEALADEQGIALELTGEGAIDGDRLMVRRALGNLLANAIAHSPRGAKVRVLLAGGAGGGCKLTMVNPGSIASDHLARMFDRFYRVDATRHAGAGGAGLGLAITRSIVEAHGGTIRAESADGEVRITIDWAAAPCLDAAVPGRGDLGVVSVQKARGGSP